ncbi:hypothetical protein HK099_004342 [Clydaea vesicula]|uniref:Uncharacterized protein n=1 Tax=Clydaea vesicula TaxID=447962 RepID=A0AAD5U0E6_9FUNG|nr:hypothetical protein HK099_004342 [Clydaea vesicula]
MEKQSLDAYNLYKLSIMHWVVATENRRVWSKGEFMECVQRIKGYDVLFLDCLTQWAAGRKYFKRNGVDPEEMENEFLYCEDCYWKRKESSALNKELNYAKKSQKLMEFKEAKIAKLRENVFLDIAKTCTSEEIQLLVPQTLNSPILKNFCCYSIQVELREEENIGQREKIVLLTMISHNPYSYNKTVTQ